MIRIVDYSTVKDQGIIASPKPLGDVSDIVAEIIAKVRAEGDRALFDYALRFDKVSLTNLAVSPEEMAEAFSAVDTEFIKILEKSAQNIKEFHTAPLCLKSSLF